MGVYRVSFVIGFVPALTISGQQRVMELLEALDVQNLDLSSAACTLDLVLDAGRAQAAKDQAEDRVARALSAAGHTMSTAPITSGSVAEVTGPA